MRISQFQKISTSQKIDKLAGIIFGVSVITDGPATGHNLTIDDTTLSQVKELGSQFSDGLKVRMNHPKKGQDAPVQSTIGALKNFRVDGDHVRADLHLLKSDENFDKIIEMAEKMPESFGLSIVFSGVHDEKDEENLARCTEIYACDLVDDPAANPTGLFSKKVSEEMCEHCGKSQHLCSCSAMSSDDHYSEYGDVPYSDTENHKYPIDTESHVRAAWSYVNMPKNAKKYSPAKLAKVKAKIKAAAKSYGIKISETTSNSTLMNEEQKKLAAALGLSEESTIEQLNAALEKIGLKKMAKDDKPPKDKKKKEDDEEEDDEGEKDEKMSALSADVSALTKLVKGLVSSGEAATALARKQQIDLLCAEAAKEGKVIPFDVEDLYVEKDGKLTIKMEPTALAKVISKLGKDHVKTSLRKPELPKDNEGKTIQLFGTGKRRNAQRSEQVREYCLARQEENIPAFGRQIKEIHRLAVEGSSTKN